MTRGRRPAAERALRALLLVYPRDFRERFGDEMRFVLRQRLETAQRGGRGQVARFWTGAVRDAVAQGISERVAASRGRVRYGRPGPFSGGRENAMGKLLQDVRYAWRSVARTPAATLVCVLTLGVGIGATTAIFTVVDSVILEPLPYPDSDRLVSVYRSLTPVDRESSSPLDLVDWERDVRAFDAVGGFTETTATFEMESGVEQVSGGRMSAGMFRVLGIPPLHGRWFLEEEDVIGGPDAVILGFGMWRDRFGEDPDIVGRPIDIEGRPRTVVGVMPPEFTFPTPESEYWIPLRGDEALRLAGVEAPGRGLGFLWVVARLAPGVTHESALAELQRVTAAIDAAEPQAELGGATLVPLHEDLVGDVRLALFTFLGAVAIVLLVSCANVANLSLVRAASRETEMAVRSALGAGRGRIMRLVLTESALVGLAGGAVGVLIAVAATGALASLAGDAIPRGHEIGIDASVLGFAGVLSLATGLLFGLFAATASARVAIASGLREGARGASASRRAGALRSGLAVAQVALALALMTGAGLLANSYYRLTGVETGFSFENVLTARVTLPTERYDSDASILQFFDELTVGVERLPGVTSVATSYSPPLASSSFRQSVEIEDGPGADAEERVWVGTVIVGEKFFEASGIPLVAGRGFGTSDRGGPAVAIVNRTMAERYWPGEDAVGRRFRITGGISGSVESLDRRYFSRDWMTVVGVAGDVRRRSLEEPPEPEFYRPHAQMAWPGMAFLIRTTMDPEGLVPALKAETARLDRTLPVTSIRTLSQLRAQATAVPRFRTALLGAFAAIASFLAIIGVYAVMSFTVGQQRREIGIRMALGASRRQVMRRVLARGIRMAGIGAAVGLAIAFAASRALGAMVFGISTQDPATYIAVTVLIVGVALAATALPARRASRVDPVGTLREG